ncbi:reprolysin-like metallopeptidase [Neolewinella antarctica]|uniref:Peptidase M12B domain-containing protein n=1 Tax=Neolewinella antarctica TaxID=442734 RepID=A0ABX0X9N4_9BACT|nr:M12 family metallo-peptidase [Neolewinella antarctica]NJC25981.1 hypothetical protein [Neolewinella antarctica]
MRNFYLLSILLLSSMLTAQYAPFTPLQPASDISTEKQALNGPTKALYFSTDRPAELATFLREVPEEKTKAAEEPTLLELPNPDGSVVTFRVQRYQIIRPELQAVYPSFVTLYGWDVKNPARRVQLDWTDRGFGASVIGGEEGRWLVEPLSEKRVDQYQSFFARDFPAGDSSSRECGFEPDEKVMEEINFHANEKRAGDCELREYRVAIACTGEYYAAVGGTEALVVAEIMRAVNRLNQVFAAEISLQLTLVNLPVAGGGVQLLFNNPNSDPYTNSDNRAMLDENQNTIDAIIGNENYDLGHVFGTGGGGVAQLRSVCRGGKARAVSGQPSPIGDPFYVSLVAHEMGHQFGATHTFNSDSPNCGPNRAAETAFEPGAGTTIMSYAGICGTASNIQFVADPQYHGISILQIATYMELGGGSSCAVTTSTANAEPTAIAGPDYSIPAGTPFVLSAAGTDPDGDGITYCWEQFDSGQELDGMPDGSEVAGPLFRTFLPTADPQRYFPNLPAVVAGGGSPWESLPTVAREMNFTVTVRDFGAAGYGCPTQDQMVVDVVDTGSPFAVTAPNGVEAYPGGSIQTFTWNVAGTDAGAINCATVDLVLSTDGGLTFTESLGTFPNSGTASVSLPAVTEPDVRLMIKCTDNIFFDVSDQDFSIEQLDYVAQALTGAATVCDGIDSVDFIFQIRSLLDYEGTITYTVQDLPTGANASFNPASTVLEKDSSVTVTLAVTGLNALADSNYAFTVLTDDGNVQKTVELFLEVLPPLEAPTLIIPFDNGFVAPNGAGFDWTDVPNVDVARGYTIDFFNDAAGTDRRGGARLNGSRANFGSNLDGFLVPGETYWWSVTAINSDCDPPQTATSELNQFTFDFAPPTGQSILATPLSQGLCGGRSAEDFFLVFFEGDLNGPVDVVLGELPVGITGSLSQTTLSDRDTAVIALEGTENLSVGSYKFNATARGANGAIETVTYILDVRDSGINLNSPLEGSTVLINRDGTGAIPLDFDPLPGASSYQATVTFPSGGMGSTSFFPITSLDITLGPVEDGGVYGIKVTADTGEESCVNFFTFVADTRSLVGDPLTQDLCGGFEVEDFTVTFFEGDLTGPVSLALEGLPDGVTGSLSQTMLADSQTAVITLQNTENLPLDTYTFDVTATDSNDVSESVTYTLIVRESNLTINTPVDGGIVPIEADGTGAIPLDFEAIPGATSYVAFTTRPDGDITSTSPFDTTSIDVTVGPVEDGDVFGVRVEANTGEGSCVNFFTFLDTTLRTSYTAQAVQETVTVCDSVDFTDFSFELESIRDYAGTITYTSRNLPTGGRIFYDPLSTTLAADETATVTFTLAGLGTLSAGSYSFTIVADDGSTQTEVDFTLEVLPPLEAPTLLTPIDGSTLDPGAAEFDWTDVANVDATDGYIISFFNDAAGTDRRGGTTTDGSTVFFGGNLNGFLIVGDTYWWSVTAVNSSCELPKFATSELGRFTFGPPRPEYGVQTSQDSSSVCNGGNFADFGFQLESTNGYEGRITYSVQDVPAGARVFFEPRSTDLTADTTVSVSFTLAGLRGLATGTYPFTVVVDDTTTQRELAFVLNVRSPLDAPTLLTPTDNDTVALSAVLFDWTDVMDVDTVDAYTVLFFGDAAGTDTLGMVDSIDQSELLFESNLNQFLTRYETYWWAVRVTDATCDPGQTVTSSLSRFTFGVFANSLSGNTTGQDLCEGQVAEDFVLTFNEGNLTGPISFTLDSLPAGVTGSFSRATLDDGQSATITLQGTDSLSLGTYTFMVTATGVNNESETLTYTVIVREGDISLTSPTDASEILINSDSTGTIPLDFDGVPGATSYTVNILSPDGGVDSVTSVTEGDDIEVGAVQNGDVFGIQVIANTGEKSCFNFVTFVDSLTIVSTNGTATGNSRNITLYPNPTTQRLFIDADAGAGEVLEYTLLTNFGQVVRRGELNGQRTEVNVADLPNAVYQIMITNGTDFRKTFRVVKQ